MGYHQKRKQRCVGNINHTRKAFDRDGRRLDPKKTVFFRELLIANMFAIQALAQLRLEKGIIGEQEYFAKLTQVDQEYQEKDLNHPANGITFRKSCTGVVQSGESKNQGLTSFPVSP